MKTITTYTNKKFKFTLPMQKAYEEDGDYFIEFALSTIDVDLEKEQMTEKAINSMVEQAKNINSFEAHQYGLNDVIGPVIDAWKSKSSELWVKVKVIPSMVNKIKELVDNGVKLGGSIGGLYVKDFMERGIRKIDEVLLLDATLTPLPVNTGTLGTARETNKTCKTSICRQIMKSINEKYFKKENGGIKIPKNKSDSIEELQSNLRIAVQEKFSKEDPWDVWVKLTFTDSIIVEVYGEVYSENKLYEIPYTVNEDGEIELGDDVEVEEQYVTKRMEILDIKSFNVDEDYYKSDAYKQYLDKQLNHNGGDYMDEKMKEDLETFGKAMGQTIVEGIKEVIQPEDAEPAIDTKTLDEEKLIENVTVGVLKALGVEIKEETSEEESGKIVIMDAKAFEEAQSDLVQKTVLEIGKQSTNTRKSKPLATPKFGGNETPEQESSQPTRKSIRKMAEESVKKDNFMKNMVKA